MSAGALCWPARLSPFRVDRRVEVVLTLEVPNEGGCEILSVERPTRSIVRKQEEAGTSEVESVWIENSLSDLASQLFLEIGDRDEIEVDQQAVAFFQLGAACTCEYLADGSSKSRVGSEGSERGAS